MPNSILHSSQQYRSAVQNTNIYILQQSRECKLRTSRHYPRQNNKFITETHTTNDEMLGITEADKKYRKRDKNVCDVYTVKTHLIK